MEVVSTLGLLAAAEHLRPVLGEVVALAAAEGFRMGLVYVHLIACCVAIGLIFTNDAAFAVQLLKGDPRARQDPAHLDLLQHTITFALVALWITGIALVSRDAALAGWGYYLNPKIQAKIVIVCLLTLNGLVLHHAVIPALKKAGTLLDLPPGRHLLALFAGAVSAVSWFYAAMLGIGRPLNWKYPLTELLAMYPLCIGAAFLALLALTGWARYRVGARLASA